MIIFKAFYKKAIFILGVLFLGCVNTEGDLEIEGKITDEFTREEVPWRKIIVQGLKKHDGKSIPVEVGQFSSDSTGGFRYLLRKVKDVRYYNFILVGDSDYAGKNNVLGLYELEQNAKFISFSISKLANLSIIINRKTEKPVNDTLSLSWNSNNVFYWSLFPYEIHNYDIANHIVNSGTELRWYGGYVNSIVKTRVFAEKKTRLNWVLDRNGRRLEFTDTITCRRDIMNKIYFSY